MKRVDGQPRKGTLILCEKCKFEISSFFYKKHFASCDGLGPYWRTVEIRRKCKPAGVKNNPAGVKNKPAGVKRKTHKWHGKFTPAGWNKGLNKESSPGVKKQAELMKGKNNGALAIWRSKYPEKYQEALAQSGGYRAGAGRGKGQHYEDSLGKTVWLQSSYEVQCADLLKQLNIRWIRPGALKYTLDKPRNYFPDFFLMDLGLYLDPKNNYLQKKDAAKIAAVVEQNNVKVVIVSKEQLTLEGMKSLLV